MVSRNSGCLILFCLFFLQTVFVWAGLSSDKKKIFYLNSYEITFQTYESSQRAINESFSPSKYIIDTDFMDSKRFYKEAMYDNLKERIRIKMKERGKYDMVLASDDDALNFVMDNYQEFFANTPVVFWGFDDYKKIAQLDSTRYVTGVMETVSVKGNIELIKRIQPKVKEIIAFTDNTSTGITDFKSLNRSKKNTMIFVFPKYTPIISRCMNCRIRSVK